ncbi:MAG: hypothetical protein WB392_14390 [Methanotrichaceae archaeon]
MAAAIQIFYQEARLPVTPGLQRASGRKQERSVGMNAVTRRLEMTTKEEVVRRIEKIDEIRTILDDIRRSEMVELEEIENARST